MRMTARATGHLRPLIALIALVALVACVAGTGCGKKKEQAAAPPGGMPSGMMPGMSGGMPGGMPGGAGGGMPGMAGGMPGMSGPGGAPGGAPGAAPGGASGGAPSSPAPSAGGAPATSPTATAAVPAPAPSAQQLALVDEALWTLRVMMRPHVLPPHPSEVKPRPTTVKTPTAAGGAAGAAPGGMGGGMPGGMGGGMMGPGAPGGMAPGGGMMGPGAPGGMAPGGGSGMMGPGAPGGATKTSHNPFSARDYRFAQGGPPPGMMPGGAGGPGGAPKTGGPAGGAPGAAPKGGAPAAGAPAAGGAAAPKTMNSMALAQAIKEVAQKTRGLDLNDQKFYHEYWFLLAKGLLDEVATKYSDFPVSELSWAAQTRTDWEGYLWHWATRKMLEQTTYSSLQDTAKIVAKARTGLAAIRAICKYGLLMNDVDRTKYNNVVQPTLKHTINCVQFAFGNPNYDPATIKRDESKRSRLVVEVFDNYLKWGHNWRWDRSRNWAYLARYSKDIPPVRCDSCGKVVTVQHQTWRCPRCGKALRPAVPGTWDSVRPFKSGGYTDDYRVAGLRNPATDSGPSGKYALRSDYNSPTYQRLREGYRNAQRVHEVVAMVSASNLPTKADKAVMEAWMKASPKPDRIPEIHRMDLEAREMRMDNAVAGGRTQPVYHSKPVYSLSPSTVDDEQDKARQAAVKRARTDRASWSTR